MSRARCPSESAEGQMLMRAATGAERDWPELALLHHIPNGGHRSKATAGRLKGEGVKPGVPDYCLPVPRGGFHGLYVELKPLRGGRVQPEQREWLAALEGNGYRVGIARGWEQAWALIRDYLAGDPADNSEVR